MTEHRPGAEVPEAVDELAALRIRGSVPSRWLGIDTRVISLDNHYVSAYWNLEKGALIRRPKCLSEPWLDKRVVREKVDL